jgi:membrane protein implicated in regulation of membrane protease activity
MAEQVDQDLVGTVGLVTLAIPSNRAGEVVLPVRGGSEAFSALCDEPVAKNSRVVVVECLSGRTVLVTPCP